MSDTEEQFDAATKFLDQFMPKARLGTRLRVRQAWIAAYRAGRESAFEEAKKAVMSEFYGHDTGEMGNRICQALDELSAEPTKESRAE